MSITSVKTLALEKISVPNYRATELIGAGGMANIYKAIQLSLDRPVALKIMHHHLSVNDGFIARFEKEAKQAAQLHHENIVSIIDYGHEAGEYYIAMEFVDGINLKQLLEKQRRLPLEVSFLICHQVAEGLKYAHSQNLVHRDIKPANIILSNDGRVMITDFGIAKGDDDLSITATGQMIGSPAYMSPEQAAGRPLDHRSDIFSLGIIIYEMLAGQKPFKGDTYQAMVTSIMSQTPDKLSKHRVDVTAEMENIVEKAITKDVESRYQSAEEFADTVFAQLERFRLPPFRKLISNFLKNPSKMTEKLRNDKISGHMESALYYLTQGESRLKDARREFRDVLRFDKNNKAARKYLARLENHNALPTDSTSITGPFIYENRWKIVTAAGILFTLISIILIIIGVSGSSTGDSAIKNRPANSSVEIEERDKEPKPKSQVSQNGKSAKGTQSEKSSSSSSKNTNNKNTTTKSSNTVKKPVAKNKSSSYNYPDQNLKEYGLLTIKTNVAAAIFIDKKRYGLSNGPAIKLEPGRHFVEIEASGYRRMTRRIFTEQGKSAEISAELESGQ